MPIQTVDETDFKIMEAAKHPDTVTLVAAWRVEHGAEGTFTDMANAKTLS